jgi:hypothetical protein
MGFGEPIECDSGNGRYLLFPIDLPNDEESTELIRRVLLATEQHVGTPDAHVDLTMFNAARIIRLMGTTNRKGDCIGERVHRIAKLIYVPDYLEKGWSEPISAERLKAVAALAVEEKKPPKNAKPGTNGHTNGHTSNGAGNYSRRLNLPRYLATRGVKYSEHHDGSYTVDCVNHDDHAASFNQTADGAPGFHCFHNRCVGFDWEQASTKLGKPTDADYDRIEKPKQPPASGAGWIPAEGETVKAKDRGNYGTVVCVSGTSITVRFVNPEDGNSCEKDMDVSELEPAGTGAPGAPKKPILRFTFREMAAVYPKLDPPVIQGLLRVREFMNVVSVAKVGKSWLCYYFLLCIATGRMIFDRFATTPGRVLLIDNELPPALLPYRIRTVAEAMGIQPDEYQDRFDIFSLRHSPRSIYELSAEFSGVPQETYIFGMLDAKYKALGPDADENSNADEARWYAEACSLIDLLGSAFGTTHHSTKGSQSEKRVVDIGAGGSSQARAADTHLVIREAEEEGAFVLGAAVRSFAPVDPLGLRFDFPLWVPDESIDPTKLKGQKSPGEEKQDGRDREAENEVLAACQTWKSRPEIETDTGLGKSRRDRAIARLMKANLLQTEKQDRPRNPNTDVFRKTIHAN